MELLDQNWRLKSSFGEMRQKLRGYRILDGIYLYLYIGLFVLSSSYFFDLTYSFSLISMTCRYSYLMASTHCWDRNTMQSLSHQLSKLSFAHLYWKNFMLLVCLIRGLLTLLGLAPVHLVSGEGWCSNLYVYASVCMHQRRMVCNSDFSKDIKNQMLMNAIQAQCGQYL